MPQVSFLRPGFGQQDLASLVPAALLCSAVHGRHRHSQTRHPISRSCPLLRCQRSERALDRFRRVGRAQRARRLARSPRRLLRSPRSQRDGTLFAPSRRGRPLRLDPGSIRPRLRIHGRVDLLDEQSALLLRRALLRRRLHAVCLRRPRPGAAFKLPLLSRILRRVAARSSLC